MNRYIWTVGYDPENNKPIKKYFYSKTRKDVQEKINETMGKVREGTYREPSKLTIPEWFTMWLNDYMKPSLRISTWENYEIQVRKHILLALGHLRLNQLQTSHLQKLYNDKLNGGRLDGKKKCIGCGKLSSKPNLEICDKCGNELKSDLSARSVRYIHTLIHAALEQAKKEGMITINVADAVKLPHDSKKEIKVLDIAEVVIFLATAKETKHFPAYFLALNTGLRRGEPY